MKKIILASLAATLALTACDKKPAEPAPAPEQTEVKADAATEQAHAEHDHEHGEEHSHEGHDHSHEGHDHAHDHHHHHDAGDKFQCGDKTVQIAVHNHEGEIEAHLTTDDITYDLNQDPADKKRFITDDGIEGEDKPMALVVDGDKAQVLNADNNVLLDCTKS